MPVSPRYMDSWRSHIDNRRPKSTEPGTDMFVPIGTPIYAPADGRVYGSGNSIMPFTGRWIGVDFDNGLRFRALHLSRLVSLPARVHRGDLIGYSGASGYGYEDFRNAPNMPDAHTHVTLWPTHESRYGYKADGKTPFTVDFMQYVGGSQSGGGSTPEPKPEPIQEDELMRITMDTSGTFWWQQVGQPKIAIRGTADLRILRRYLNSISKVTPEGDGLNTETVFHPSEITVIDQYLTGYDPS